MELIYQVFKVLGSEKNELCVKIIGKGGVLRELVYLTGIEISQVEERLLFKMSFQIIIKLNI
ncbi:hypothetical protein [Gracilibacillus salitolerans]|uniref:hypothetical protein n=1 Tax=Gracilibacillus salitolerans TaxID=2663022 RepID=UPI001E64752E|nr:hypothetical protein [Gracilibacillus salitolerans]